MKVPTFTPNMDVRRLVKDAGGPTVVSKSLGVSRQAIHNWQNRGVIRSDFLIRVGLMIKDNGKNFKITDYIAYDSAK